MSVAVDRDQAFLDEVAPDRRRTWPPSTPTRSTATPASPSEAVAALREAAALSAFVPAELGGGGVSLRGAGPAPATSSAAGARRRAMVFAMHQIQVATIVRHLDGAPWFEDYLRRRRRRAAADRLGHLRDRDRRRHGPLDRAGDPGRRRRAAASRSRRRRSATAPTPTTCSPPSRRSEAADQVDQVLVLHHATRPSSSRRAPGTRSACAAPARPGSRCARGSRPEQILAGAVLRRS